jgi:hypothetical protein
VSNASFSGSANNAMMNLCVDSIGKGNDQELLAFERGCDRLFIFVVDTCNLDTFGKLGRAAVASQGGDGVFSRLEKLFYDMGTLTTRSLK